MDINCDMGESYGRFRLGRDEEVMPYVTSCNIACGFHGGDPLTIERTLLLAKKWKVRVGAHPSFPDLAGFGRRSMQIPLEELRALLVYQIAALKGMAESMGLSLQHVKPHGALYHAAMREAKVAEVLLEAMLAIDSGLVVYGPAKIGWEDAARIRGVRYVCEAFADRHYLDDGSLVPRSHPEAVIYEPEQIVARALRMMEKGTVTALSGKEIPIVVQTLCIHGDHPRVVEVAKKLRAALGGKAED